MMFKHHTIHIHQVRNESESYQNFSRILIYSNFRLNIEPQQQYHFRCPKQGYIVSVQLNRNSDRDKCQLTSAINRLNKPLALKDNPIFRKNKAPESK